MMLSFSVLYFDVHHLDIGNQILMMRLLILNICFCFQGDSHLYANRHGI